jgi:putative FmdB family regulatory protein
MPTYEYECEACGKTFAVIEHMSKHTGRAPACPHCKSKQTRQVTSGFYAKTVRKS